MVQTTFSEKRKISKTKNFKKSGFLSYTCVYVRVKDENLGIFPDIDAIKHRNIAFKPVFSPVERTKPENGIVVSLCLKKWLRTL